MWWTKYFFTTPPRFWPAAARFHSRLAADSISSAKLRKRKTFPCTGSGSVLRSRDTYTIRTRRRMFTGLIEEVGRVEAVSDARGTRRITVTGPRKTAQLDEGDSVS